MVKLSKINLLGDFLKSSLIVLFALLTGDKNLALLVADTIDRIVDADLILDR